MALPLFETTDQGHGFKLTSTNLAIQKNKCFVKDI